jgi:hypothetical protein
MRNKDVSHLNASYSLWVWAQAMLSTTNKIQINDLNTTIMPPHTYIRFAEIVISSGLMHLLRQGIGTH